MRISPAYLLLTVPIAYAVFRARHVGGGFFAWLLPGSIVFHRSHITDIELYVLGRLVSAAGILGSVSLTAVTAAAVMSGLGREAGAGDLHPALLALLIAAVNDFGVYWIHRCHHGLAALWPFHAVHHSAEVLTPVTVYRKHPVYDLISTLGRSFLFGIAQGIVLAVVAGKVEITQIAGANFVYVLFNLAGSNLRHRHLWLGYGRVLEHILISPAQHQIHHSRALRHKDRNYGEILAVWDWMFGTLYVPAEREALDFGLSDDRGRAIAQPHDSLARALAVTALFDAARSAIDPAAYDGWWHSDVPLPLAVPVSLLFANEWGALGVRLGTNGPYWSLSYEAAYYVLFGLAVYLRGPRRLLMLAAAGLIFGLKVLLLMPAWIMGVAVYRLLAGNRGTPGTGTRVAAATLAVGSAGAYAVCLAAGLPDALSALSSGWLRTPALLRFSDEFLWNALIGGLFAAHLYAMGILLHQTGDACGIARTIRWLAGASFSVYLVHYPALQLMDAALPDAPGLARDLVLISATLAACLAFARIFERPLPAIRRRLRQFGGLPVRSKAGNSAV